MAVQAAKQRAARTTKQAAAAREVACIARTHTEAALARAGAAEAALSAAQTATQRAHAKAAAALVRCPPESPTASRSMLNSAAPP